MLCDMDAADLLTSETHLVTLDLMFMRLEILLTARTCLLKM